MYRHDPPPFSVPLSLPMNEKRICHVFGVLFVRTFLAKVMFNLSYYCQYLKKYTVNLLKQTSFFSSCNLFYYYKFFYKYL